VQIFDQIASTIALLVTLPLLAGCGLGSKLVVTALTALAFNFYLEAQKNDNYEKSHLYWHLCVTTAQAVVAVCVKRRAQRE